MEKHKQALSNSFFICESDASLPQSFEEKIQGTNDDASDLKASAVALGYWKDPFISYFVAPQSGRLRTAEMHRGCFVRVKGIETIVRQFLAVYGSQGQVLSLGAGYDTLYWKLRQDNVALKCFVEVDFDNIVLKKKAVLEEHAAIFNPSSNAHGSAPVKMTDSKNEIHMGNYYMVGSDLRDVKELNDYFVTKHVLDFAEPILIVLECVLMYLSSGECQNLLAYLVNAFSNSILLCYEPAGTGSDNFMTIFESNMERRGIPVPGLQNFKDDAAVRSLLLNAGWEKVTHWRANYVFEKCFPSDTVRRIQKIEFLDEPILLSQLLQHYIFAIASKGRYMNRLSFIGFV
ncbi:LCM domain containing protein [Trichuris trichiura]|uniref:Leucine carboxyl methyltransferase 1 n=1 Tax=Trichuris trichiura TaxID=36087 RepID=A0A077Z7T6_TRITR|nr:LCM domain containing protein [Trichuris trichiura]